jgi:hypothetical protein
MEGGTTSENHSRTDNVDHQRRPTCNDLAVEHGPGRSDANRDGTPTPGVLLCDSRTVNRRVGETTLLTRPRRSANDGGGVPPATLSSESTPEPAAHPTARARRADISRIATRGGTKLAARQGPNRGAGSTLLTLWLRPPRHAGQVPGVRPHARGSDRVKRRVLKPLALRSRVLWVAAVNSESSGDPAQRQSWGSTPAAEQRRGRECHHR